MVYYYYFFVICTYKVTVSSYKKTHPIGYLTPWLRIGSIWNDTDYAFLNRFSFQFK